MYGNKINRVANTFFYNKNLRDKEDNYFLINQK